VSRIIHGFVTAADNQGEQDPCFGASFVFSCHRDELVIAGVFARIYNEQV